MTHMHRRIAPASSRWQPDQTATLARPTAPRRTGRDKLLIHTLGGWFQIAGFEPCNRVRWRPILRHLGDRRRSQLAQSAAGSNSSTGLPAASWAKGESEAASVGRLGVPSANAMTLMRLIMHHRGKTHAHPAFDPSGFTHGLVPHFKPITTGVCSDAPELRFSLTRVTIRSVSDSETRHGLLWPSAQT